MEQSPLKIVGSRWISKNGDAKTMEVRHVSLCSQSCQLSVIGALHTVNDFLTKPYMRVSTKFPLNISTISRPFILLLDSQYVPVNSGVQSHIFFSFGRHVPPLRHGDEVQHNAEDNNEYYAFKSYECV